mmetsp:Transcript_9120/g.15408  ORF Transcript_9120/g.15408 Transcript_9120/m.15408 type:complete len:212 (-) Transcript_9120:249-884(-)|eukprot:CAMPEP_0114428218 /NCGR_PEP_ID=MMETSP0103-20121206/8805_1 /TAXON_ID=37642 ORGANISM="Paraphysomonas imperforata, Strain PA2" /NCGR_SAMPLE_ID=MMETSP0103 /ASSEMBLY_ACC=CAM_ASM_000201 /LENGTH=211 /DNA_ID=CAMNT_0001597413 /DNA_START=34 /DNA_END=669 /DNA_ORIENTATION=+
MTEQATEIVNAEVVEIADVVIDDVESGGKSDDLIDESDPGNKTCYTPIIKQANDLYEQKIHPALLPVQEKVYPIYEEKVAPVITKVGELFDDDEEDPVEQIETTDEEGNVVHTDATLFKVSPSCFGAAVLGFTVATIVTGPFVAVAAGVGAGYATSTTGKAGEYSKFYGKKTYNGLHRGYKHSKSAMNLLKEKIVGVKAEGNAAPASLEAA